MLLAARIKTYAEGLILVKTQVFRPRVAEL